MFARWNTWAGAAGAAASSFLSVAAVSPERVVAAAPSISDQQVVKIAQGQNAPSQPLKLLQVHVLFRHGDRTPMPLGNASEEESAMWEARIQPHPAELPKRKHSKGIEYPFGQLTTKGAGQAHALGLGLRERYGVLLNLVGPDGRPTSDSANPDSLISVRSTDFPRTYLTAFYVLKGLLGSEAAAASRPISIQDPKDENLYYNDHCARGQLIWTQKWKELSRPMPDPEGSGSEDNRWRQEHQDLKDAMAAFFKLSYSTKFPWTVAIDNVDCRLFHGLPVPPGVTEERVAQVRRLLAQDYEAVFASQESCQLAMGRLLNELVEAMERQVADGAGVRLALYSGHDATLLPLAVSLGRPLDTWPPYASSINIELWASHDNKHHFVRILYNNVEIAMPPTSPWKGGSWLEAGPWRDTGAVMCTWEQFQSIVAWSQVSEEEYKLRCQLPSQL